MSTDFRTEAFIQKHLADARVNVELETEGMVLNIGPQHPATPGTALLRGIGPPPRAPYIRTILTELSRIATFLLFLGEMGVQVGALTPPFYGFRDREHVLNLIEAATGGRFHPTFNPIGGLE